LSRSWWFVFSMCVMAIGVMAGNARAEDRVRRETWFGELGIGMSGQVDDAYVRRLHDFGFDSGPMFENEIGISTQSIGYMFRPNYGVLLRHEGLEHRQLHRRRDAEHGDDEFRWDSRAVLLGLRARHPFLHEWFAVYGQLDLGLGIARSSYQNLGEDSHVELDFAPVASVVAGLAANFFKYGGGYIEAGYTYARMLENNFGDKHQDGGFTVTAGLRLRALEGE
jgi:hypothetical protein